MKAFYLILIFMFILFFSCKEEIQSPVSLEKESNPSVIGDTSKNMNQPTGFVHTPPSAIKQVQPEYPPKARDAGISGKVYVKCLITVLGKVRGAVILKSDCELFNRPSLEAAMQWEFTQALLEDGTPVECWILVPFIFRI